MSTVVDIVEAIERLPDAEREELESRLLARRFGLDALSDEEHSLLIASLDEARKDVAAGRSHTADEMRTAVDSWIGR